jgi:hypothetical protein
MVFNKNFKTDNLLKNIYLIKVRSGSPILIVMNENWKVNGHFLYTKLLRKVTVNSLRT